MKTKLQVQFLEGRDVPSSFPPEPGAPYPLPHEAAIARAVEAEARAEARESRDGHIRNVINANPTWTQAKKDAITNAVLELAHAADNMAWSGSVGVFGDCNQWVDKYQQTNFKLIQKLEKLGLVKIDPVSWDNNNTVSQIIGVFTDPPGHAALRITLPDGTVFYLDDTNRGGRDHMFMQNEVPGYYVPGPFTMAPRNPWTLP